MREELYNIDWNGSNSKLPPILGLTNPEYPILVKKIIKAIGMGIKNFFKYIWKNIFRVYQYLVSESEKAAFIHNQMNEIRSERDSRNYFYLRCMF